MAVKSTSNSRLLEKKGHLDLLVNQEEEAVFAGAAVDIHQESRQEKVRRIRRIARKTSVAAAVDIAVAVADSVDPTATLPARMSTTRIMTTATNLPRLVPLAEEVDIAEEAAQEKMSTLALLLKT
jgi:hypothetical protein